MVAVKWGTRGTRPPTFSDSGDIICHVSPHFLFRFRNIYLFHANLPPTFYNKIAPMNSSVLKLGIYAAVCAVCLVYQNSVRV